MKKFLRFICVLSLLLVVICSQVSAAPRYTVTDLNALTGLPSIHDMSASGWVCGFDTVWSAETGLIKIGTLGGPYSEAEAINNSGQVVGSSYVPGYLKHAFLWSPDNSIIDLGTLGGPWSWAYDINNSGQVVGRSDIRSNTVILGYRAFLWSSESGMINLGTLDNGNSSACAINDLGQVVGTVYHMGPPRGFLWTKETGMQNLNVIAGKTFIPNAINNTGQVVGYTSGNYYHCAALLTPGSGLVNLGVLPGCNSSSAYAVNNNGQVVGTSEVSLSTYMRKAFVWKPDTGMIDLNTLVTLPTGYKLESASKIFDDGRILSRMRTPGAGSGYKDVLLTPIVIRVEIDIKPGDDANTINMKSKGNTQVAVLASSDFDPTSVDPATVTLAGAPVVVKGKGQHMTSLKDVNGDGLKDLVLHIITQQMNLKVGDTKAVLQGSTFDGTPIAGEDSVKVIK